MVSPTKRCATSTPPARWRPSMPDDVRTQFDYLLNALMHAGQADKPAEHGYAEKRRALFAYVRQLEAAQLQAPAAWVLGPIADGKVLTTIKPTAGGATPVYAA